MGEAVAVIATDLAVGQRDHVTKTVNESDVYLFAGLTGDSNPVHVNEAYASRTRFGGRLVHGMLTAGMVSAVIGTRLPGPGTIYLGQDLKFLAPVKIGDTLRAEVEVIEVQMSRKVKLRTTCTNQDGVKVLDGIATVQSPR